MDDVGPGASPGAVVVTAGESAARSEGATLLHDHGQSAEGAPAGTFSDQARYDLDMNAFALVKTYRHGKGTTYPDMNWEPKQAFHAVADYCAAH